MDEKTRDKDGMFSFIDGNRLQDSADISAIRGEKNAEGNWKGAEGGGFADGRMVDGGNVYSDENFSEMGDVNQREEMELGDFGQREAMEMGDSGQREAMEMGDVGQRRAVSEEWEDFGINGEIGKSDSGLFEAIG